MKASIQVVTSDFTRAMRDLSRMTGVSFADVIRAETQSILESAAKKTVAAKVKLIEANVKNRPVRSLDGKRYYMQNKYPDALWARLQEQIKRSIVKRKAARGLSKKSWMQAAQTLGISINVPAYVANATSTKGDYPNNASATEKNDGKGFYIEIFNARTYSGSVFDAIRASIKGRTNFFKQNLKRGVFQKTSEIAAKYPGLKVS